MPTGDLPEGTASDDTALSFDEGVEDLAALLQDPEDPDPQSGNEDHGPDDTGEGNEPGPDDIEADAEGDGPEEIAAGGKFVSRDAKVRLDDGTVISVGDLARNNLFQRDYTRKTEELKSERQKFESERSQLSEHTQALAAQREFLYQAYQQIAPSAPNKAWMDPNSAEYDPIKFQHAEYDFNEGQKILGQIYQGIQADHARVQEEADKKAAETKRIAREQMYEANPDLRDRAAYQKFWGEAVDVLADYGYSEKEFAESMDPRIYKIAKELILLKKARTKAPKVQQETQTKPRLIRGSVRGGPEARNTRAAEQRADKLRKTGDFDAGVARLMDLIS